MAQFHYNFHRCRRKAVPMSLLVVLVRRSPDRNVPVHILFRASLRQVYLSYHCSSASITELMSSNLSIFRTHYIVLIIELGMLLFHSFLNLTILECYSISTVTRVPWSLRILDFIIMLQGLEFTLMCNGNHALSVPDDSHDR